MIQSYSIGEMEQLTGTNRRTISDYITKGLLAGPSHRGRGAVYSQRDLNVLQLIPRLRTLMKAEFNSLKAVAGFVGQLGTSDIHTLANRRVERSFVVEVRRLRVRKALMAMMPHVSPERFDLVLDELSPEQICSIDAGRMQIGAVIDMARLFEDSGNAAYDGVKPSAHGNGHSQRSLDNTDLLPQPDLDFAAKVAKEAASEIQSANTDYTKNLLALKLDEIANRLDRVERMLTETEQEQ